MRTLPLDITEEQLQNLRRLHAHISTAADPKHFNMRSYCRGPGDFEDCPPLKATADQLAECGTTACLAGHGPAAGIEGQAGENWNEYNYRAYGTYHGSALWKWLFSPGWDIYMPTIQYARDRLFYTLIHRAVPYGNFHDCVRFAMLFCGDCKSPDLLKLREFLDRG